MSSIIYLFFYAIVWGVLLYFFIRKNKEVGIGGSIIIAYFVSSIATIIFFNGIGEVLDGVGEISLMPLCYLFFCINICVFPIYLHSKKLLKLPYRKTTQELTLFKIFMTAIIPFAIEGFLEVLYVSIVTKTDSFVKIYDSEVDIVGQQLSFIGRITTFICRLLVYVWPFLFFYFINIKKYRMYAYIAIIAYMVNILYSYSNAARVGIVRWILLFVINFLLWRKSLDSIIKKRIVTIGLVAFSLFVIMLSLITINRFEHLSTSSGLGTWLSLYLGEAPINFCQYLWDLDKTENGDNMFALITQILGMDPIIDMTERREHWAGILGIPTHIFYSFVGDLFLDLGKFITPLFCISFCILLESYIRKILLRGYYDIISLYMLSIVLLAFTFGFMYFPFKVYNMQICLLCSCIFMVICHITTRKIK